VADLPRNARWRGWTVYRIAGMSSRTETRPPAGAESILERHGVRATAQRVRVAEVLLTAPRHMTAEQILEALRHSSQRISKATVYNTLKLFVARGLARQVFVDPERCVYDSTMAPHHHFRNVDTGEMIDIRPEDIAFAKLPPLPTGTEIADVEVVIRLRQRG